MQKSLHRIEGPRRKKWGASREKVAMYVFDWLIDCFTVDSEAGRQEEISAGYRCPAPSNPHERQCAEEHRENVTLWCYAFDPHSGDRVATIYWSLVVTFIKRILYKVTIFCKLLSSDKLWHLFGYFYDDVHASGGIFKKIFYTGTSRSVIENDFYLLKFWSF